MKKYTIKTQNITLNIYVINFPIYIYHQFADEYIIQKQPLVVFFRLATLFKIESSAGVFL